METAQASTANLAILFIHWQVPKRIYNPTLNVFIFGNWTFLQWDINKHINMFIGQSEKVTHRFHPCTAGVSVLFLPEQMKVILQC